MKDGFLKFAVFIFTVGVMFIAAAMMIKNQSSPAGEAERFSVVARQVVHSRNVIVIRDAKTGREYIMSEYHLTDITGLEKQAQTEKP